MADKQPPARKVHRTDTQINRMQREHDKPRDRFERLLGIKKGGK